MVGQRWNGQLCDFHDERVKARWITQVWFSDKESWSYRYCDSCKKEDDLREVASAKFMADNPQISNLPYNQIPEVQIREVRLFL